MDMLALLPLVTFICFFLVLGNIWPAAGWRWAYLRAALLWGVVVVVMTEALSLLGAINVFGLSLGWGISLLAGSGWLLWRCLKNRKISIPHWPQLEHWTDRTLLFGIVLIVVLTALVSWFAPPQTWDAMIYHMSRVAHWAQEEAVTPFATGIEVQNSRPPWAEFVILHFYVLSGGDRLANAIEWFAMISSLVGVALIAKELGANKRGQLFAVTFAATLPMGITQASSTMNDYVVAFWIIAVAAEAIALRQNPSERLRVFFLSLGVGLALLTKPTAVAYLAPFALWIAIFLVKRVGWKSMLLMSMFALILVFILNAGYLLRNYSIYDSVFDPTELSLHGGQPHTPQVLLSNVLRNASLHAGTPSPHINKAVALFVVKLHDLIGLDVNDPRTTSAGRFHVFEPSTHEDLVGNFLHALLILIMIGLVVGKRNKITSLLIVYASITLATFLVFSFIFKWQVFASRYHLPFFILFAPLAGIILERFIHRKIALAVGWLLLFASWPWLVSINSRPLLPIPERSYVGSVLVEPRNKLYFANGLYLLEPYKNITERIKEVACEQVGIMLSGNSAEYPLWALLGAPNKSLRVEWIVEGTASARYASSDFSPCAVICENCSFLDETIRGLHQVFEYDSYRLYLSVSTPSQ